jgi:hypothetical protein
LELCTKAPDCVVLQGVIVCLFCCKICNVFCFFSYILKCAVNPCLNKPPINEDGKCDNPFCKIDVLNNVCVYDECSRLLLDDCLQHDAEGMLF